MQSHCTSSLEQVFVAEEERECRNVRRHMSKVSLLVMYSTVPSSYEAKCSTNYMKECSSSGFIENSSVARKMPKENCCLILLIRRISCLIATRSSRNMVSISVEILESGVGGILVASAQRVFQLGFQRRISTEECHQALKQTCKQVFRQTFRNAPMQRCTQAPGEVCYHYPIIQICHTRETCFQDSR